MRIGNFDRRLGYSIVALTLVGTLAGIIMTGPTENVGTRTITNGFYTAEDVRKNKEEIDRIISEGGSGTVKTFGKKRREVAPKKITTV